MKIKIITFSNEPEFFFVETENCLMDDIDMIAYGGKRVNWPDLEEKAMRENLKGWQSLEDHCILDGYRWVVKKGVTKANAISFWRDLMGTLWHNPDTIQTHGIMGEYLVASHMEIEVSKAKEFLDACVEYGITERQGSGYVV